MNVIQSPRIGGKLAHLHRFLPVCSFRSIIVSVISVIGGEPIKNDPAGIITIMGPKEPSFSLSWNSRPEAVGIGAGGEDGAGGVGNTTSVVMGRGTEGGVTLGAGHSGGILVGTKKKLSRSDVISQGSCWPLVIFKPPPESPPAAAPPATC